VRRTLIVFTAALVMVAMMVVMSVPTFGQGKGLEEQTRNKGGHVTDAQGEAKGHETEYVTKGNQKAPPGQN
jgi:hypothetical protein